MQAAFSVSLSANWCVTHQLSRRGAARVPVGPTTARQDGRGRKMKRDPLVEDSKEKRKKKINRDDDDVADDSQRFFPLARGYKPAIFRQCCLCAAHPGLKAINHSVWSSGSLLTRLWKRRILPLLYSQSWDEGNI